MNLEANFPKIQSVNPELFNFHSRATSPNLANNRILIVDASEANRRYVKACLRGLDQTLITANSTSEAIGSLSQNKVDLILVDWAVPEMGGVEFCRMVKKTPATHFVPVFVIGASDDPDEEIMGIEAGADEFLVKPFRPKTFRARVQASLRRKAMLESLDDPETVLFSLAQSVEDREPGLGRHCERIASLSVALGASIGLPIQDLVALHRGGYLHDIGKVAVPDNVLFKPGPLTSEEWTVMQAHTERGERICCNMRSLAPVLPIIRHHHEKWNGTGYPDGLKGEDTPLLARILQVADIYDALTTVRPYKRAFTPEEALKIMKDEAQKGWRDMELIEKFAEILPKLQGAAGVPDVSNFSLQALASSVNRRQLTSRTSLEQLLTVP